MTTALVYRQGATEPSAAIEVTNDAGVAADLSGSSLTLRVGTSQTVTFVKTDGLTYAAGVVTADWEPAGEIGDLPVGQYLFDVIATKNGEQRIFSGSLTIAKTVGPTPVLLPDSWTAPTVDGSRTDGTALASLLTGLESMGLVVDESTP